MNIQEEDLVIVRGINKDWIAKNFINMWIGFGGSPIGIPKKDARYIGLYIEAPISKITHIGIINQINHYQGNTDYYIKTLIKLDNPRDVGHAIRKHEYWHLNDFDLTPTELTIINA